MNWKILLALFVVLTSAGCAERAPRRLYGCRLVRPDGVTHKEIKLRAYKPRVIPYHSGHAVAGVFDTLLRAPVGWLWEIETVAEKEEQQ